MSFSGQPETPQVCSATIADWSKHLGLVRGIGIGIGHAVWVPSPSPLSLYLLPHFPFPNLTLPLENPALTLLTLAQTLTL